MTTVNTTTELFPARMPMEIRALFGEPPVLRSENVALYHQMMYKFSELIKPNDALEWWWVKELTDDTWEVRRLRRLKVSFVESRRNTWHANKTYAADALAKDDEPAVGVPMPDSERELHPTVCRSAGSLQKGGFR